MKPNIFGNCSVMTVPLFEKEGIGEIFKINPPFSKGEAQFRSHTEQLPILILLGFALLCPT
jgi:hypothetical protein